MRARQFTVHEINLLLEALRSRAARLESMARANPRSAGPNERKAQQMHTLSAQLRSSTMTR